VVAARAATRYTGEVAELVASSTDANVPISLGIPAIALGAGGRSGGAHTSGEWYENEGGVAGLQRLLLILLSMAGLAARR
jgi:acetylornithine deacetylase/succinyl-diaminopimelate desuccinylase-like protein